MICTNTYWRLYVHTSIRLHVHTGTSIRLHVHTGTSIRLHVHTDASILLHAHIDATIHLHVHMYASIRLYVHIDTNMFTETLQLYSYMKENAYMTYRSIKIQAQTTHICAHNCTNT